MKKKKRKILTEIDVALIVCGGLTYVWGGEGGMKCFELVEEESIGE
jgi:hypothetical protein